GPAEERTGARVVRLDQQVRRVLDEDVRELPAFAEVRLQPRELVHQRVDRPDLAPAHFDRQADAAGEAARATVRPAPVGELPEGGVEDEPGRAHGPDLADRRSGAPAPDASAGPAAGPLTAASRSGLLAPMIEWSEQ